MSDEQIPYTLQDRDIMIRLNGKVDYLIQEVKDLKDDTKLRMVKLEARVSYLENWRWFVVGISTVVSVIGGALINKYL